MYTSNCVRKVNIQTYIYTQCIKLLIYNIKGEGLPATDTGHNEECHPHPRPLHIIRLTAIITNPKPYLSANSYV